ncbi:MAG: DUF962 domain-containing protein [Xanthomonadales bacterium]|nr:DUF962 domain-containing protein [Xanthomonadales bacterium]
MSKRFNSFSEFYPFYLAEHSNPVCKGLHFVGTWLVIAVTVFAIYTRQWAYLWLMPVVGYGFAWIGHFFFEHNRPATFKHPVYSLIGDWVMWKDIMVGKVKF